MGQFTTANLVGNRVVVSGTDVNGVTGSTTLDSTQWEEVKAHTEFSRAESDFNTAVEDFFAPLTEAVDALQGTFQRKPEDPAAFVVLEEAEEGKAPVKGQLIKLGRDAIILRLIEQGEDSRLIWVNDELEVLEYVATP